MEDKKYFQYNAAIYARLSKEDGENRESNSIKNQKELIKDYIKQLPEIRICSEHSDDGYSGVDFSRPAFTAMLEDIKAGKINCVIVKDFSRFGRNYIEAGKYLENIFPFLGVRFISVNDNYDSAKNRSDSDDLIIPFKNLINDAYLRDISVKIRSQLLIKCKKGDFVGNFPVYGYMKSPENKNKLIIDEYAAEVVRDIFRRKLEGFSPQAIADRLNESGELSPLEYKNFIGFNTSDSFKKKDKALWSAGAVLRILGNPVYTGVLEQGKTATPNHKIKKRVVKPKEERIIREDTHEAIIDKQIFEITAGLLLRDTRAAPEKTSVHIFSGMLFCADCGNSMVRKTVPRKNKKYIYHVCSTNKNNGSCTRHSTSEKTLAEIILSVLQTQIKLFTDFEAVMLYADSFSGKDNEVKKLSASVILREAEIKKYRELKASVYEDFKDGLFDSEEFESFNALYTFKLTEAEKAAKRLKSSVKALENNKIKSPVEEFIYNKNITELTRKILVSLVEQINIFDDGVIEIVFNYGDSFQKAV